MRTIVSYLDPSSETRPWLWAQQCCPNLYDWVVLSCFNISVSLRSWILNSINSAIRKKSFAMVGVITRRWQSVATLLASVRLAVKFTHFFLWAMEDHERSPPLGGGLSCTGQRPLGAPVVGGHQAQGSLSWGLWEKPSPPPQERTRHAAAPEEESTAATDSLQGGRDGVRVTAEGLRRR